MYSFVALGWSPLRQNNCSSPNYNAIYLFRNWEEAGWLVLQNVPLLGLEQESTIPAQRARTSTSLWSTRNQISTAGGVLQDSQWGFICIIAAPHHSLITPRRDSQACFPGTVLVTWHMLNGNKNSIHIYDYFLSQCSKWWFGALAVYHSDKFDVAY